MSSESTQQEWYASWFDTKYYHILYGDRDHEEAAGFMRRLTESLQLDQDAHILDLACGRGRHSMYLNKLGYKVTGVDLSENSIAFAKAELSIKLAQSKSLDPSYQTFNPSRLSFKVHDMTQPMGEQFDAVFNLFTSFGYFETEEDNLKTICAIKSNLNRGGHAVIDFLNVPYVLRKLVVSNQKCEQGIVFHMNRRFEDGHIIKDISFEDEGSEYHYTERVKALMLSDFKRFFDKAGLELTQVYGNYQLDAYDRFDSDRLIMVVKNPN